MMLFAGCMSPVILIDFVWFFSQLRRQTPLLRQIVTGNFPTVENAIFYEACHVKGMGPKKQIFGVNEQIPGRDQSD